MSAWLPSSVLRVWLEAWRADAGLGPEAAVALTSYRGSARFGAAREAAQDRGDPDAAGLARTVLSVDALAMAQVGHGESALALLVALLEAPFAPHPLGAAPERFAARLAAVLGDDVAVQRFAARATALEGAFGDAEALAGVGSLLVHGELRATLTADVPARPASERPPSTFVAQAADEASTRAYVVTVGHRRDPHGTRFELHRATLSDITDDHGGVPAIADLVLAFDADAAAMLERLDPEQLELRFVFRGSTTFEGFDTHRGNLFDVEAVPSEGRLYLRLLLPTGWTAAGVALEDIWWSLESCVLVDPGST
jgi:hypothetical protein